MAPDASQLPVVAPDGAVPAGVAIAGAAIAGGAIAGRAAAPSGSACRAGSACDCTVDRPFAGPPDGALASPFDGAFGCLLAGAFDRSLACPLPRCEIARAGSPFFPAGAAAVGFGFGLGFGCGAFAGWGPSRVHASDRKSVVWGKSVDLGGLRIIKKKKKRK